MRNATIRIVLVNPSHPGNIGAVARAMKTMGFEELYLVSPKCFPAPEAKALAVHAEDILEKAKVIGSLCEALEGVHIVYASSANPRATNVVVETPRQAAQQIVKAPSTQKIAIVFGPENHGLSNEHLRYAHAIIQIPTADIYRSLNLAAAVQTICYELHCAFLLETVPEKTNEKVSLATVDEMEIFYQALEKLLIQRQLLDPQKPRQLMSRLRRLFNRSQVDKGDLDLLWGVIKAVLTKQNQ